MENIRLWFDSKLHHSFEKYRIMWPDVLEGATVRMKLNRFTHYPTQVGPFYFRLNPIFTKVIEVQISVGLKINLLLEYGHFFHLEMENIRGCRVSS